MIFDNPRYEQFRKIAIDRGITFRTIWSAKSNPNSKFDDIWLLDVRYNPYKLDNRPKHSTIIVQDYGNDHGFGVWLDSQTGEYDDSVTEIIEGIK